MFMFHYRFLLWITRGLGRTFYRLKHGWFPPVFWLLVTVALIWIVDTIRHIMNPKADVWFQIGYILAMYVICWLLWWAWMAHKRVVIDTFMDYRGTNPVSDAQGLATLLVVKLAQLHELYQVVDEQRAISTATNTSQPIDATIKVDDVSDFLTGAVSAQSKLSLGPIEIPVGTLLALFGRFVQGPRIIGSLHQDYDMLILTAQRIGGRPAYSWRVDSMSSTENAQVVNRGLDEMIDELACRMFTDLALSGTVRWKAAQSFSDGLRVYRDCLRSSKDRLLNLKQAERKFIETLEEDEDFVLAHYNLGVVYMEMRKADESMTTGELEAAENKSMKNGQLEAAEEAFLEANSHNPGSWLAYYALAACRYQRGQYDSAFRICQRIRERQITQKPGRMNSAKIFHMMGLTQFMQQECQPQQDSSELDNVRLAIKYYKTSLRLAWGALCRAEWVQLGVTDTQNLVIPQLEATLSVCMKDLAWAYTHYAENLQEQEKTKGQQQTLFTKVWQRFSRKIPYSQYYYLAHEWLHLASFLHSPDSQNYFALFDTYADNYVHIADEYCEQGNYTKAITEYQAALRIYPENAGFWSNFALAYAGLYTQQQKNRPVEASKSKKQALKACKNARTYVYDNARAYDGNISERTFLLIDNMIQTYEKLEESVPLQQMKCVDTFLRKVLIYQEEGVSNIEKLDKLVKEITYIAPDDKDIQAWIYAQVSLVIGKMYLQFGLQIAVEQYIRGAIACLENTYQRVIREQELRVILVYALLQQGRYEDALKEAEYALVLDPLCYLEREALGDVYFKLNAFENAIAAWQESLLRKNTFVPKLKELPKIEVPVLDFKLGTTYLFKQDDVDINFKIGIGYVELGRHYHDLEQKRSAYRQALVYLERAEALYETNFDRQQQKQALYYFLGVLHFEQDDYQRAISYLRIAKTLKFARLTSLFYLGYAYLKNKEYDSCMKQFQALYEGALQCMQSGIAYDTIVEGETVGFMSLGELLAMAHWGMAFAFAERNANLENAYELILNAEKYICDIAPGTKKYWTAYCQDCKGWILFKQNDIAQAIKVLEHAVTLSANPQIYVHLALAYERKSQGTKEEKLLQQLRYCYQQVQELDIKNEYTREMEVVFQCLQKAEQPDKSPAYD